MKTEQEIQEAADLLGDQEHPRPTSSGVLRGEFIDGFIKGAKWHQEQDQWIAVSERLPEIQEPVLVYLPTYGTPNMIPMWLADWADGKLWFSTAWSTKELHEVTHWMPLPKAPKEKDNG